MAAWIARMERLYPELYQAIAVERNQRWVPRFKSMLQEDKPTMVVLGFGHLVGPDSVQEQLRQNGLIAQRL
jgi:hypothetical protein